MTQAALPEGIAKLKERVESHQLLDYLRMGHWLTVAKSWAWRVTAAYFWFWVLTSLTDSSSPPLATRFLNASADTLAQTLALVGLRPPNLPTFVFVLRGVWLLTITGLHPAQLIGLALYTMAFPFGAVLYLFFRKALREVVPAAKNEAMARGLVYRRPPFRLRALLLVVFLSWFLLYGNSITKSQLFVGAVAALLLFVAQVLRSFVVSQAVQGQKRTAVDWFERLAYSLANAAYDDKSAPPSHKAEAVFRRYLFHPAHVLCRRLALLTRGQRGQIRAAAYVVLGYFWALTLLCLTAVAFWAATIQAFAAPQVLPLDQLLSFTFAHFLSGITAPPRGASVPFWVDAGASLTSWVLFVVYLAAATATIGERQRQMAERLAVAYKRLRLFAVALARHDHSLRRRAEALPFKA